MSAEYVDDVASDAAAAEALFRAVGALSERVAELTKADRAQGDVADSQRGRVFPTQLIVRDAQQGPKPPAEGIIPWDLLPPRLVTLAEAINLTDLEVAVLLVALAPAVDPRFEHFYVVLNNETESLGPSVGTALRLAGYSPFTLDARSTFGPESALCSLGLINLGPVKRPLVSQLITVPERLVGYLLGDNEIDPFLARAYKRMTRPFLPDELLPEFDGSYEWPIILRSRSGTAGIDQGRRIAYAVTGDEALVLDASTFEFESDGLKALTSIISREVVLSRQLALVDCRTTEPDAPLASLLSEFEHVGLPAVVVIDTRRNLGPWDKRAIALPMPSVAQREGWWALLAPDEDSALARVATHLDPDDILALRPDAQAPVISRASGVQRRSRVQTVKPAVTLADVILDERPAEQMRYLVSRVRHRSTVLDEWGMRPGGARGRGVTALFAGPSGTGKTMSAEALAGELGVPLFLVDLASVIDKYIGETEKNLEEVFRTVENEDGVLLFDEADALFGKRSEVSDSKDRYANIEVAYLLQRIEAFDGLAILTTNLRANLDEAFQRRLDMIVDFPAPGKGARATIWRSALGQFSGCLSDDDYSALSEIDITGGSIRAAVVTSAYLAAGEETTVARKHVLLGLREEWRKVGRINFPAELFSSWEEG